MQLWGKPGGDIVWSAAYDAQGRVQKLLVDEIAQPLRFQGQYFDEETRLCYNRYRYYDPATCSFISQDPIGLAGGENVYAYAPSVWGWMDPLGLCKNSGNSIKLYHGTRHDLALFVKGIDPSLGGGQLGPGFCVTTEKETAEWFARFWGGGGGKGSPKLLEFEMPLDEYNKLKILRLKSDSPEYLALSDAWGQPVSGNLKPLINDFDAIHAPVYFDNQVGTQLKFNPRSKSLLNSLKMNVTHL